MLSTFYNELWNYLKQPNVIIGLALIIIGLVCVILSARIVRTVRKVDVVENNDREVIENELIYENNSYHIDFEDLEEKLALEDTKLMLLCNPHNPIGKIWDRESLEKIGRLCKKHDVIMVSDEIHCDLTNPGLKYVPFASLDDDIVKNSIITIAPSKTFNIAGLQSSMVYTTNEEFYSKIQNQLTWDFSS